MLSSIYKEEARKITVIKRSIGAEISLITDYLEAKFFEIIKEKLEETFLLHPSKKATIERLKIGRAHV